MAVLVVMGKPSSLVLKKSRKGEVTNQDLSASLYRIDKALSKSRINFIRSCYKFFSVALVSTFGIILISFVLNMTLLKGLTQMTHEVRKCFHAVGNGTLFTGQIHDTNNGDIFNWMYDCGSTSKKTVLNTIADLPNWFGPCSVIDMLVISHFDNDHVNGLEALLQKYYVRRLVLPFTEWSQSIREIAVMGPKGITPSVALLQINPSKWLELNNLIDKVGEILLVQGDGGPQETDSSPDNPNDDSPQWKEHSVFYPEPGAIDEDTPPLPEGKQEFPADRTAVEKVFFELKNLTGTAPIKVAKINQNQSIYCANNSFEFMFYNAAKPFSALGLVYESNGEMYAKVSKVSMSLVKADIEATLISLGLHQEIIDLPVNWRQTLKDLYETHFGSTGEAKNNISLCMYAAPLSKRMRLGTLFNGDINLTSGVIEDMKAHFGQHRWLSLIGVQVPHHGSQHCWAAGNATSFEKVSFIQCATPTKYHPHELVIKDLNAHGCRVFSASRTSCACAHYYY